MISNQLGSSDHSFLVDTSIDRPMIDDDWCKMMLLCDGHSELKLPTVTNHSLGSSLWYSVVSLLKSNSHSILELYILSRSIFLLYPYVLYSITTYYNLDNLIGFSACINLENGGCLLQPLQQKPIGLQSHRVPLSPIKSLTHEVPSKFPISPPLSESMRIPWSFTCRSLPPGASQTSSAGKPGASAPH